MATVREVLFDLMRQLGMTKIFGNVGSTEEPMLKSFPRDFEYILALQESVAVAMGDAYAQVSGKVAHVNLHTAAGSGNGMGNIETAFYNRTPMIITAGQHMREMLIHEPYLTNKNPYKQAEPWVKWSYEPARAEDVPAAFLRAYVTAIQAPAGPVYLSLPMDDMDRECAGLPLPRKIEARLSAGKDVLQTVADALAESKTPALVFGGAVDQTGGWYDAVALAEKLNAAVWAAPFEGRPGFPENHPLFRGGLLSGMSSICKQLEGYDLVVVIGAPVFRYYPYAPGAPLPKGTRLFHLTDSAEESARAVVGDSIVCDPARACATLVELLPATFRSAPEPVPPSPEAAAGETITADYLYYLVGKLRPNDSVIAQESLSTLGQLKDRIRTTEPRSFFSMFSGVLGYGLPAAGGLALAERELGTNRKVICLVGDGAAQYVIQSFWTAAQHELPVLYIVLRNHAYNILKSFSKYLVAPEVPGFDLPGIDIVQIAKGYGCNGAYCSKPSELEDAIIEGLQSPLPYVLQIEIDATVPALLGKIGPETQYELPR
ncbi:benzoylformate decarboxylase [Acidicapsa ligni]|uniref:benzoylformate decarboxylase n=1 Tax=Acidicapsa ligni TaxID=542300 RepID=UPI0021E00DF4|nr:benzoylformate decarboxylase [Acidicapsa ligni]